MSVLNDTIDWLADAASLSGDDRISNRVLEHLGYTVETVAIASVIAIPLGLWIGHTGRFKLIAVGATGAMRALPTLGLLTLIGLYLGIGLTAPLVALVVLAIPPLLAGAYAGIEAVDPQTVDAARSMGFTELQILTRVEVPLGLAIIVGGIRSAVLQVVATATVAAYVGLGGLGRYLIDGQAVSDYPQMAGGSFLVVVLALILDAVFAALQALATRNHRPSRHPLTV